MYVFLFFGYVANHLIVDMIGVYNPDSPNDDDFELWSPSLEREEICLFGRRVRLARFRYDVSY
jgi:hypothetical protein